MPKHLLSLSINKLLLFTEITYEERRSSCILIDLDLMALTRPKGAGATSLHTLAIAMSRPHHIMVQFWLIVVGR